MDYARLSTLKLLDKNHKHLKKDYNNKRKVDGKNLKIGEEAYGKK